MAAPTPSNKPLASQPSDCCFTTVKHTGTPVGKSISIADVPTYLSEPRSAGAGEGPEESKKIILFLSDVFGPFYLNNQLLQDYFAQNGFITLGIDYFLGDPVYIHTEEGFDRAAWMKKSRKQAEDVLPRWWSGVKEIYGDAKYCVVGYCFGAPQTMEFAATDDVVAAAFAHPAGLNENHFRNVKKPLLLSCAETDQLFPPDFRRRGEDILVDLKAQYHIQVFSGVSHGFAVRGDPGVPDARWAKEESARSIVSWFERFSAEEKKARL